VRKNVYLVNRINNFNGNVQEIVLNFSVRMPKNHTFCDSSIERTVQISFAQSQKLSLKKAKLSFKKRCSIISKISRLDRYQTMVLATALLIAFLVFNRD